MTGVPTPTASPVEDHYVTLSEGLAVQAAQGANGTALVRINAGVVQHDIRPPVNRGQSGGELRQVIARLRDYIEHEHASCPGCECSPSSPFS